MTKFLLIRHGETAWHLPTAKGAIGWGAEMAPLTEEGTRQVKNITQQVRDWSPELILSSPTSRTLNTCAILSVALNLPFVVEFELHEWIPDNRLNWDSVDTILAAQKEMESLNGEWPLEDSRHWEPLSSVRQRTLSVLKKYLTHTKVAVVCHEWVIYALTSERVGLAGSKDYIIKA